MIFAGVMILSKYKFAEVMLQDFTTRLGRKALWGVLQLDDKTQLAFGTFHLESYPQDGRYRRLQMELYSRLLAPYSHAIITGDSNFVEDDEDVALGTSFADAWRTLYHTSAESKQKNPGASFLAPANILRRLHVRWRDEHYDLQPGQQSLDAYRPSVLHAQDDQANRHGGDR